MESIIEFRLSIALFLQAINIVPRARIVKQRVLENRKSKVDRNSRSLAIFESRFSIALIFAGKNWARS